MGKYITNFRVWDCKKEKFYNSLECKSIKISHDGEAYCKIERPLFSTGYHDRNGREIYEGDYIILNDDDIEPLLVDYQGGAWIAHWQYVIVFVFINDHPKYEKSILVVGNIHEGIFNETN